MLRYTVAVRSLDGSGPQTRGVSVGAAAKGTDEGYTTCTFPLKNTGAAAATTRRCTRRTPTRSSAATSTASSASASGTGWTAHLKNALATAKFGETVQVPVYIEKAAGAAATGSVTLNATSESDPRSRCRSTARSARATRSAARSRRRWR